MISPKGRYFQTKLFTMSYVFESIPIISAIKNDVSEKCNYPILDFYHFSMLKVTGFIMLVKILE